VGSVVARGGGGGGGGVWGGGRKGAGEKGRTGVAGYRRGGFLVQVAVQERG